MERLADLIQQKIVEAFPDAKVTVTDPQNDGQHLEAEVISSSFEGLSRVQQHKMVMQVLKNDFDTRLHALRLKTLSS